jgi:hypothetical protein
METFWVAIGSLAAVAGVLVTVFQKRKKPKKPYNKMATGLRFGFHTYALYYWVKLKAVQKRMNARTPDEHLANLMKQSVEDEIGTCQKLSKQLGITFSADSIILENMEVSELPFYNSQIETSVVALPYDVRQCIVTGQLIGSTFYRVYFVLFAWHTATVNGLEPGPSSESESFVESIRGQLKKLNSEFAKTELKMTLLSEPIAIIKSALLQLTTHHIGDTNALHDAVVDIKDSVNSVAAKISQLGN